MHRPKKALVRIVRLAEGGVVVDETGKQKGRGAYICRQQTCWQQALKRGTLNRTLRTTLMEADVTALQVYAAALPEALELDEAVPEIENSTEEV